MADRLPELIDIIERARGRMGAVANQPKTPTRTVRVDDEIWLPALAIARDRDETLSTVMRDALEAYIKEHTVSEDS